MACAHRESAAATHSEGGGSKEMVIKPSLWFIHRKPAFPCTASQLAHSGHRGQRRNCNTAPSGLHTWFSGSARQSGFPSPGLNTQDLSWARELSLHKQKTPMEGKDSTGHKINRHICKAWQRVSLLIPIRLMGTRTRSHSLCCPDLDNSAQKVHLWQF